MSKLINDLHLLDALVAACQASSKASHLEFNAETDYSSDDGKAPCIDILGDDGDTLAEIPYPSAEWAEHDVALLRQLFPFADGFNETPFAAWCKRKNVELVKRSSGWLALHTRWVPATATNGVSGITPKTEIVGEAKTFVDLELAVTLVALGNAHKTMTGAGGHGKAADNERLWVKYHQRVVALGANPQDISRAQRAGEFNGLGSC